MEAKTFLPDYLEAKLDGPDLIYAKVREQQVQLIKQWEDGFIHELLKRGKLPHFSNSLEIKSYRDSIISQGYMALPAFSVIYGATPKIINEYIRGGFLPYCIVPAPHYKKKPHRQEGNFGIYIDIKKIELSSDFARPCRHST